MGLGQVFRICIWIINSRSGVGLIGCYIETKHIKLGTHPNRIGRRPSGFNEYIRPLAWTKSNDLGHIGLDRDEIVGHNNQVVIINRELLASSTTGIDQSQEMCLAGMKTKLGHTSTACIAASFVGVEAAVKRHLAIDEIVLDRQKVWRDIVNGQ